MRATTVIGDNKSCPKCGEWKSISDFYRDKTSPNGRCSWCKVCTSAHRKTPKVKARWRAWWERYKGKPSYERVRRDANEVRKAKNEYVKAWRLKNPEKWKETRDTYVKKNPETIRRIRAEHRIRRREKYNWMKQKLAELGIEV